jgi:hypothetical protein
MILVPACMSEESDGLCSVGLSTRLVAAFFPLFPTSSKLCLCQQPGHSCGREWTTKVGLEVIASGWYGDAAWPDSSDLPDDLL